MTDTAIRPALRVIPRRTIKRLDVDRGDQFVSWKLRPHLPVTPIGGSENQC